MGQDDVGDFRHVVCVCVCVYECVCSICSILRTSDRTNQSCTLRVQEVHTKSEVVHPTPGQLGLGVIFNTHA